MKKGHIFLLVLFVMIVNTLISIIINETSENNTNSNGFFTTSTEKRNEDNANLQTSRRNSITEAVKKIEPAVVSINVIKTQIVRNNNFFGDPFFGFFNMPQMKQQVQSIGSGVIIDSDGYIATNGHVVDGATQIKVVLADGREFDAKTIGIDTERDVAVIQVKGEKLPYAIMGTSDDLIVGEWSIAVGNPYGYLMSDAKPSVSVGVISASNRNFAGRQDGTVYKGMIQTDAAINPGNSGGPLVNIYGEVIGLNTFIFSESGGSVGIGFAIPINRVKKVITALIQNGKIKDVNYGFKVQDMNQNLASALNVTENEGVVVAQIDPNGPAADAGLKLKDVITSINGYRTKDTNDTQLAISDIFPGDDITIQIDRKGNKMTLTMKAKPL